MYLNEDSSHYVSALGMFNDFLYKSSGVELKLMTDMDKYLMVKKGICEGMTMASHHFAKANNSKYPDYNPGKPTSWILYDDMNALYSGVITQYMPTEILEKFGMKITKIHNALKFRYIEKNICKCKIAKANGDEFGIMYYKLKNNAIFDKQMENIRKHMREGITAIYMLKETEDIYKDQVERPDIFDFNYSGDLFLMKNKTKGEAIWQNVSLKPKIYSILPVEHNPYTLEDPDAEDPKKKHGI
ncbi:hypothetical protein RhiirA4_462263 [Rhizophagus irregularis]|uniref:DNA-directed DNA polymerase n=1 Tax=Rhizophagus irregularis TaxID=588596 RepID=A0A2I1GKJ5_9GLOM|nr:hypothetical protein RhiirA4_462263 [Rhizophagus irregularis]